MLRSLAFASLLAASAALLGCSHDAGQASVEVETPGGYGFHFLDEGASAKLAYGEANSDNIGLMLECAKGSRTVEVSDLVRTAPAPVLTLTSGEAQSDLKVEILPGPGADMALGRAPLASPALAGFRRSGWMQVSYAGLTYAMAASNRERPTVERFFAACEERA